MSRARFYLPPEHWQGNTLTLGGDEARHCSQVTRHRIGDEVIVFDGKGRRITGRIDSISKHSVEIIRLEEPVLQAPLAPVTLVQGIVKGDTMEWIIEKAVELGVKRIIPVITAHSVVRLSAADAGKKREKWQRVALEACKQCGQDWLPEVATPCDLSTALEIARDVAFKLTASLAENARPLASFWTRTMDDGAPDTSSLGVAIGPEGDFSPDEYLLLNLEGWLAWSLGPLTLRSETAAICALSILTYEGNIADQH